MFLKIHTKKLMKTLYISKVKIPKFFSLILRKKILTHIIGNKN